LAELKRYEVKYIRDSVKSNYPPKIECRICGSKVELHYHHFNTLALLYNTWAKKNNVKVETTEEMGVVKKEFTALYWDELVNLGACLCKKHHERLHQLYGKTPPLNTAGKQERWVERQREKKYGN